MKKLCIATLIAGGLGLYATYTRGAWIAYMGGIGILLVLKKKWTVLISAILITCIFIAVMPTAFPDSKLSESIESIVHPFNPDNFRVTASNTHRLLLWQASVSMFKENPIFGIGPLRFGQELPGYLPDTSQSQEIDYTHAHNLYFDTLATTGLVGLAGLLVFIGGLFYRLAIKYCKAQNFFEREILLAALIALTCMCLGCLTEMCFRRAQTAYSLSFLIGLALSSSNDSKLID